jgi:hypothetical protein
MKFSDDLTADDFKAHAVWREISLEPGARGWKMKPVAKRPLADPSKCWIGSTCWFANGDKHFLVLSFINNHNALLNRHVTTLMAFTLTGQLRLCRYFGPEVRERGAAPFASAFGLPVPAVFPVKYDLRGIVSGDGAALCGQIEEPPDPPLSQREVMKLIVSSLKP